MIETLLPILIWIGIAIGLFLGLFLCLFLINGITHVFVYIRNDEFGVIEKIWAARGSVKTGFMSLDNSAGYQPEVLRGGPHFFRPFQFRVHKQKLITVRNLAYIFARDGVPLPAGQTLAKTPDGVFYEDARNFLAKGGQRGPQRMIVREGVYAFNTALFVVMTNDHTWAIDIGDDKKALDEMREIIEHRSGFEPVVIRQEDDVIGVVTIQDGPVLEHGSIIAPAVGTDRANDATFHNSYQDVEKFLAAGGYRGRQEQVLTEGTYYINRLFATIENKPKTFIAIGFVGVVISYTGVSGVDISGDDYKHGSLVAKGQKGVWAEPLSPGKYPFNPFAYNVVMVPTTNFVLRWIQGRREDHGLDSNLAEIKLITRDAFEPILPLSIVIHISPRNAPMLIQQFAEVKKLVDQTIDPMVSAYFKDAAQQMTMLELINKRSELQEAAKAQMRPRFAGYNIEVQEVLIGTPRAEDNDTRIKSLLDQIRDRQLALEQQETYVSQGNAAREQQKLNEAQAAALQQTNLTNSAILITVADNEGNALLKRRTQEAAAIRVTAEAEAYQVIQQGEALATRTRAVGLAEGDAIKAQVEAFTGTGAEYKLRTTIAEVLGATLKESKMPLVPNVMITGKDNPSGTMVEAMLAMLISGGKNNLPDDIQYR